MNKIFLYFLISFFSGQAFGQKITIKDLKSFASKTTDEVAEVLLNKDFELTSYPLGKEFNLKNGEESLSVDFKDNDPFYNYKYVRLCYSAKFNKDFETIVAQIKTQGQKNPSFFQIMVFI